MFWQNFCLAVLLLLQISGICSAAARNESLIQTRIKEGANADIEDAKFVVSIRASAYEEQQYGLGYKCTGSLVSSNVVLTAAHCLFASGTSDNIHFAHPSNFLVVMGNVERYQKDKNTLKFKVREVVPGNVNIGLHHDIGLLVLHGKVPKDHPTIAPIALNSGTPTDGIKCKAYGWGDMGGNQLPDLLQVAKIPLITLETCAATTELTRNLHKGMICAGLLQGGPAPCQGDSGGPLICNGIQVGVFSWSRNCGHEYLPAVYTHVAKYKSWIKKHIQLHGGSKAKFEKIK